MMAVLMMALAAVFSPDTFHRELIGA